MWSDVYVYHRTEELCIFPESSRSISIFHYILFLRSSSNKLMDTLVTQVYLF